MHRADRVRELFDAVADMEHPAAAALLERSEPDADVRREVLELLSADQAPNAVLDADAEALAGAIGASAGDPERFIGRRIGPFHIERVLGQGGMGTVYQVRRDDIGLQAALKLVRGALADPGRVARFRREAEVLARLNHPYIAKLLDVGVSDDGTPYIAMELIRGRAITAWCDDQQLSIGARLKLFVDLCDAVSFAHQQLVVHRDIKPLNVLVTPEGVVKLLDFGVAKLLDDERDSVQTTTGTRLLSPDYASPEQVVGGAITTATDVHALGILLFELLTGHRPFRSAPAGAATPVAVTLQAVLLNDPPRASSLMASKVVNRGDLDAICFKAMAKAPGRRYASVAELAADVRRHIDRRPVSARLPTLRYRAGKFVQRHVLGVFVAAFAAVALLGGAGVLTWQINSARARLEQARQISGYLLDIFNTKDPAETRVIDAPMRSYLQLALVNMDGLSEQPAAQARLMTVLSRAYVGLGDYARADTLATRAVASWQDIAGAPDVDVGASLAALGNARHELGNRVGAATAMRAALQLQRRSLGDAADEATEAMLRLAEILGSQGEYDEAENLAREALAQRLGDGSRRDESVADATTRLGTILALRGNREVEAERLLRAGLTVRTEVYPEGDYRLGRSLTPLAQFLNQSGRGVEAEQMARRALALRATVFGPDHPRTIAGLNLVASSLETQGRIGDARKIYMDVVRTYERLPGGERLMLAVALTNVAATFATESRLDSAEAYMTRALGIRERAEGPSSPNVAQLRYRIGLLQRRAGALDRAESSFGRAYVDEQRVLGDSNPVTLRSGALLGAVLTQRGRLDEAERVLLPVVTRQTELLREPHPDLTRSVAYLGLLQDARGQSDAAFATLTRALSLARNAIAADNPIRREVVAAMIAYYRAHGDVAKAERLREEEQGVALPAVRSAVGTAPPPGVSKPPP